MTVRIETDGSGKVVIWTEVGGKPVPLPADDVYFRASDGHCFVAPSGPVPLARLRPHEPEMVEHWLCEKGAGIGPNIFAGEPPHG